MKILRLNILMLTSGFIDSWWFFNSPSSMEPQTDNRDNPGTQNPSSWQQIVILTVRWRRGRLNLLLFSFCSLLLFQVAMPLDGFFYDSRMDLLLFGFAPISFSAFKTVPISLLGSPIRGLSSPSFTEVGKWPQQRQNHFCGVNVDFAAI